MTRAWEFLAEKVLAVDGFSRPALDGKKASNRFTLLVKQHLVYQKTSKYLSGVNQDETEKDILLDELTALYTDNDKSKTQKKALEAAKRTVREVGAKFVRDEAMSRASRRQSQEPSDTDAPTSGKKRLLMEIQESEVALEREKLEFKKMKFEKEFQEREKERDERREIREVEIRRTDAMTALIQQLLASAPRK
ncbi:Aste57867_7689 [Aphanomyces stellatus]|uniref:Aste57867_7689 protein n=3 Tax=Aphanomyces stellatus TaxID=120398 RepID=A0A485KIM1_9STRA|nr:hypothetical protein As57867_007660 [Aphanomyces stellatus]VFT84592.1 Aste57867_7689 [Aphanomyces stellatus]